MNENKETRRQVEAVAMVGAAEGLSANTISAQVAEAFRIEWSPNAIRKWGKRRGLHIREMEKNPSPEHVVERVRPTFEPLPRIVPESFTRHLFIPDTQCRPNEDLSHMYWAGRFAAEHEPDTIVHAGDNWDMSSLSSYEKPGSKYHENQRYSLDIEAGNRGMELFEEGLQQFKRASWNPRKVFTLGNHEDRITRAINESPRLEGTISLDDLNLKSLGWEVFDFLMPVQIDGVWYAHYWYARNSGRPYGGSIDNRLRTAGHSFTQGHQQGLAWGRRELGNGTAHLGLVAGSYYQHNEDFRGAQAVNEWRGIVIKNEVANGDYDPSFISLNYLQRTFA